MQYGFYLSKKYKNLFGIDLYLPELEEYAFYRDLDKSFKIRDIIELVNEFYQLRKLINISTGIAINANDFFSVASADTVIINAKDLEWVIPIFKKYGWKGIEACISYIAKQMPIKDHMTKVFNEAYEDIKKNNPKVYSEY